MSAQDMSQPDRDWPAFQAIRGNLPRGRKTALRQRVGRAVQVLPPVSGPLGRGVRILSR